MLLEGVARRLDQAGAWLWRLQRVDGRRVDAFVADLHCSRVHRCAAPTVSNVSARAQRGIGSMRVPVQCSGPVCLSRGHRSTAVMILLQMVELGAVPWAFIQFENGCKGRHTHDLAIGSYKLGFLLKCNAGFGLGVIRIAYLL
jgi:hypothetical protein